jgi:hypothetical protein
MHFKHNQPFPLYTLVLNILATVTGNYLICLRWSHLFTKISFEEEVSVMTYINMKSML